MRQQWGSGESWLKVDRVNQVVIGLTMVWSGWTAGGKGFGPHEKGLVKRRKGALMANIKV